MTGMMVKRNICLFFLHLTSNEQYWVLKTQEIQLIQIIQNTMKKGAKSPMQHESLHTLVPFDSCYPFALLFQELIMNVRPDRTLGVAFNIPAIVEHSRGAADLRNILGVAPREPAHRMLGL